MDVLITNTTLLNGGDAAILFAMMEILRAAFGPGLSLAISDRQAELAGRYYPELGVTPTLFDTLSAWQSVPWRRNLVLFRLLLAARLWRTPLGPVLVRSLPVPVRQAFERIVAANLVMAPGGTYLVPHHRYLPHLFEILVAYAARRPYVLFTQSLGPFPRSQRASHVARFLLQRARLILVRDKQSRGHLIELGISAGHIVECADSVFAFPDGGRAVPVSQRYLAGGPLRVAISVRDWGHFGAGDMDTYRKSVAALTERLVTHYRAEVTFLSTCQGTPGYWYDDSEAADKIMALLPESVQQRVTIDREFHKPAQIVEILKNYSAVVATRMHFGILSLVAGTPVLPIAYEFKTEQLYAKFGLGDFVQNIETLTPESLCATFDRFHGALGWLVDKVVAVTLVERADAMAAGMKVKEYLSKPTPDASPSADLRPA